MKQLLFLFNKGIVKKISVLTALLFFSLFSLVNSTHAGSCGCPAYVLDEYSNLPGITVEDHCINPTGINHFDLTCPEDGSCDVVFADGRRLSFKCEYLPRPMQPGGMCGCHDNAKSNDCYVDLYGECKGDCYYENGQVWGCFNTSHEDPVYEDPFTPPPAPGGPMTPMPGGPGTPGPSGSGSGSTPGGPSTPLPAGTCKCDAGFLPDASHNGRKIFLVEPTPENPDPCEEVSIEWCTRTDCEIKYAYEDGSIAFTHKTKCSYVYDSGRAIPPAGGPATPNPGAPISGSSSGSTIPPGGGGTRPTGPVTGCLSDAECGEYCCIGGVCNSCKNRIDQLEGNDAQKPTGGSILELIINRQFNNQSKVKPSPKQME